MTSLQADGYERIGLGANAFSHHLDGDEPFLSRSCTADLQLVEGQMRYVELVGVRGAGKSTHLRRWNARHGGAFHHVAPGRQRWRFPPIRPLVFWDEFDRLPAPLRRQALWRAKRQGCTVVAGTHRRLAPEAERLGFAVESQELVPLTVAEVQEWAEARLALVALPGSRFELPMAVIDSVTAQAGSSLREAGDLLHVWLARHARGDDARGIDTQGTIASAYGSVERR